jgi:hypothetical protein
MRGVFPYIMASLIFFGAQGRYKPAEERVREYISKNLSKLRVSNADIVATKAEDCSLDYAMFLYVFGKKPPILLLYDLGGFSLEPPCDKGIEKKTKDIIKNTKMEPDVYCADMNWNVVLDPEEVFFDICKDGWNGNEIWGPYVMKKKEKNSTRN